MTGTYNALVSSSLANLRVVANAKLISSPDQRADDTSPCIPQSGLIRFVDLCIDDHGAFVIRASRE